MRRSIILSFAALSFIVPGLLVASDRTGAISTDWPWWRGPNRDGIAASNQNPPRVWSRTNNVIWKTPVPGRGHGSPTIVGNQIFLPTADEKHEVQSVLCYDRTTGKQVWKSEVHRGPLNPKNKKASQASATIACDGDRLFVNFLNNGAVYTTALTRSGEKVWKRKVSDYVVHQGYGSSPTLHNSLVIVTADNKAGGAVVAFDRETGKEVWRHDRPATANYPSPIILRTSGRHQLLLSGCNLVSGFEPSSGKKLWEVDGSTTECVTTAVTDGQLVFTSGGYPKNHVSAVRTDGSGETVWEDPTRVYVPSMVVRDGYLYAITDAGIAMCWHSATGKNVWKKRLGGTFSASPVLVGNLIYATNESGTTFVLEVSPDGCELIGENRLGNEVIATPTICGSRIYLRVAYFEGDVRQEYLFCIGRKGA